METALDHVQNDLDELKVLIREMRDDLYRMKGQFYGPSKKPNGTSAAMEVMKHVISALLGALLALLGLKGGL